MLVNFFVPLLEELMRETDIGDIWFQQDGTTTYTARVSKTKLPQMFPIAPFYEG